MFYRSITVTNHNHAGNELPHEFKEKQENMTHRSAAIFLKLQLSEDYVIMVAGVLDIDDL